MSRSFIITMSTSASGSCQCDHPRPVAAPVLTGARRASAGRYGPVHRPLAPAARGDSDARLAETKKKRGLQPGNQKGLWPRVTRYYSTLSLRGSSADSESEWAKLVRPCHGSQRTSRLREPFWAAQALAHLAGRLPPPRARASGKHVHLPPDPRPSWAASCDQGPHRAPPPSRPGPPPPARPPARPPRADPRRTHKPHRS
jgi:hypothetical protein